MNTSTREPSAGEASAAPTRDGSSNTPTGDPTVGWYTPSGNDGDVVPGNSFSERGGQLAARQIVGPPLQNLAQQPVQVGRPVVGKPR